MLTDAPSPPLILSESLPEIELTPEGAQVLAQAVFQQAIKEVITRDVCKQHLKKAAMFWLQSEGAIPFIDAAGFDFEKVQLWIKAGCPISKEIIKKGGNPEM